MPEQPSVVYHLDFGGHIPPGRLVHPVETPDGTVEVYFHPLHIREPLVWELNWVTQHCVGFEYWRQRWTYDGRMHEAPEGLAIAESAWEIVPARKMPEGRYVFQFELKGSSFWKIRSGYCTESLRREMNLMLARIAGDGLWEQVWDEGGGLPISRPQPALLAPSLLPATI